MVVYNNMNIAMKCDTCGEIMRLFEDKKEITEHETQKIKHQCINCYCKEKNL